MAESTVQIARKRRHLTLLEKMRSGKTLSAPETRELEKYEAAAPVSQSVNAPPGKGSRPSESAVREAGFACEDLAGAAERLGRTDLETLFKTSKRLSAAWERGRLLRRVQQTAARGIVAEEADRFLDLPRGTLVARMVKDRLLAEVWGDAHFEARGRARAGLMQLAEAGDARAMKLWERLLFEEGKPVQPVEFDRLTPTQMESAVGIRRQVLDRWAKEDGLPRNGDGSYSLARFIEWVRRHERDLATGGQTAAGLNPLQSEKARRERRENDEAEARLVKIGVHVEDLTRRAYCLYAAINPHRIKDWVQNLAGKSVEEQEQVLAGEFAKVLAAYKKVSLDIPLPDEARAKIEEGLGLLMKDD